MDVGQFHPYTEGSALRPTFFELYAADKLGSSLKAALAYSLSVVAQRRGPGGAAAQGLMMLEDEIFLLLSAVLEAQSLRTTEGSFAESLYGNMWLCRYM